MLNNVQTICYPVTKYLQTSDLDSIQAIGLVTHEMKILKSERSKFDDVLKCANTFRIEGQELIDADENPSFDVPLQEALPTYMVSIKKRRFLTNMSLINQ